MWHRCCWRFPSCTRRERLLQFDNPYLPVQPRLAVHARRPPVLRRDAPPSRGRPLSLPTLRVRGSAGSDLRAGCKRGNHSRGGLFNYCRDLLRRAPFRKDGAGKRGGGILGEGGGVGRKASAKFDVYVLWFLNRNVMWLVVVRAMKIRRDFGRPVSFVGVP